MKRGRRWGTWDALAMLLNGVFGLAAAAGAAGCGGCCCCDRRPEGRGGQQQEGHDGEPPLSWSHPGRPLRPRPPAAKRELGRIGFRNSINRSRLGKLSKRRDFVRDKWRGEREREENGSSDQLVHSYQTEAAAPLWIHSIYFFPLQS